MKAALLLPSLMVLGQVFMAAAAPKKETFVDHCAPKDKGDKAAKVDYSDADKQGKKFEREGVKKAKTTIPQLGKDLAAPFTHPLQKAWAIYTWLHHYVQFDAVPNSTRKTPELVIVKGIGVSKDYAKLFEELARGAGLDVMYIEGHGKGPGYKDPPPGSPLPPFESNHAWNAVKVDGKWQPIDPSYGAYIVKIPEKKYAQHFNSKHFDSTPEVFRLTHYPEKPEHQFCSDVISWKDYIWPPASLKPPAPPTVYAGFTKIGLDDKDVTPKVGMLPAGGAIRFTVKSVCKNPPIKKGERYLLFLSDGGELTPLKMEVEGRVWSAMLPTLDPGTVGLVVLDTFEGRDAKGFTLEEYEKAKKARSGGIHFKTIVQWKVQDPEADMTKEDPGPEKTPILTNSKDADDSDLACLDYTAADAQGAKFPPGDVKSLRKLAKDLTSPFTSQILQARALFIWITTNIVYDYKTITESVMHKSAEKVVREGMGSCQGYTELFDKLAQYAGLEVIYIVGPVKANGVVQPTHAWNGVKLNGRWRPIDTTWGAGRTLRDGKITGAGFNSRFFTSSPEVFRRDHFPPKPEEQFTSKAISREEWERQPQTPWIANAEKNLGLNLQELKPDHKQIPAGKPTRFEVKCRCGPIKPEDQHILVLIVDGDIFTLKLGEDGCLWSAVVTPKEREPVTLAYVSQLGDKSGKGLTMKEYDATPPNIRRGLSTLAQWQVE